MLFHKSLDGQHIAKKQLARAAVAVFQECQIDKGEVRGVVWCSYDFRSITNAANCDNCLLFNSKQTHKITRMLHTLKK